VKFISIQHIFLGKVIFNRLSIFILICLVVLTVLPLISPANCVFLWGLCFPGGWPKQMPFISDSGRHRSNVLGAGSYHSSCRSSTLIVLFSPQTPNSGLQIQNCSGIDFDKLAAVLIYLVPGFGHGFGHRGALFCNPGRAGFSSSLLSNAS